MHIINTILHGKCFVRYLCTRCFCIRNLTCSLRSLIRFLIRQQLLHKYRTPALSMKHSLSPPDSITKIRSWTFDGIKKPMKQELIPVRVKNHWEHINSLSRTREKRNFGSTVFFKPSNIIWFGFVSRWAISSQELLPFHPCRWFILG